jgi:hypothetical protein
MSTGDLVHLSEAVAERKDKRHESLHVSRSCFFHLLTVIYIVPMLDHQESGGAWSEESCGTAPCYDAPRAATRKEVRTRAHVYTSCCITFYRAVPITPCYARSCHPSLSSLSIIQHDYGLLRRHDRALLQHHWGRLRHDTGLSLWNDCYQ